MFFKCSLVFCFFFFFLGFGRWKFFVLSSTFALDICLSNFLGRDINLGGIYEQQMFCLVSQSHYYISCVSAAFRIVFIAVSFGPRLIFPLFFYPREILSHSYNIRVQTACGENLILGILHGGTLCRLSAAVIGKLMTLTHFSRTSFPNKRLGQSTW